MKIINTVLFTSLILFLIGCKLSDSEESRSPELSGIELRSPFFRDATDFIYAEDPLFISVTFYDADNDPDTLYLNINSSDGALVHSNGIGNYALHDESLWKVNFDTQELSTGDYSVTLYALDRDNNKSNTLSKDFAIIADPRDLITTADLLVTLGVPNCVVEDSVQGEPFRINYQIQNNSTCTIDLIQVQFKVIYDGDPPVYTTGIMNGLAGGETRTEIAKTSEIHGDDDSLAVITIEDVTIQFF